MKTLNYVNLMLLFVLSLSFTSCGDEIYYTDDYLRNSDEKLCAKKWVYGYIDEEGGREYQLILEFDKNGAGIEIEKTKSKLANGEWIPEFSTNTTPFKWKWIDKDMEGIHMDFYQTKEYYFDNVWVRGHYLSGKLNGTEITFTQENYRP